MATRAEVRCDVSTGEILAWRMLTPTESPVGGAGFIVEEHFPITEDELSEHYVVDTGVVVKKNYLALSTTATDSAIPTEDVPDIPADGVSTATITIKKTKGDTDGAMTAVGDNDTVYVETTAGKLSAQSVSLVKGTADITLTSTVETIIAEVTVYDPNDAMCEAKIQIQFA